MTDRGPLRLGEVHLAAGRAGAVVGARHRVGLPRDHAGLPGGRGRAPRHRASRSGTFFAKEIAGPLGADFHIGLPRRARRPRRPGDPARRRFRCPRTRREIIMRDLRPTRRSIASQSWTMPWRRAEIPAAGGHGNARSVALVQSSLSCGGETKNGVRLLSDAGCEMAFEKQISGVDLVLGLPMHLRNGLRPELGRDFRSAPTLGPASGAVGAARSSSTTSTRG